MTEYALIRHPAEVAGAAGIELFAAIAAGPGPVLELRYRLRGALERVVLPPRAASQRADRLWERTCFEAFVAPAGGERYVEINVSPSTEWAVYELDGYRRGMRPLPLARAPAISVVEASTELRATAAVDCSALADASWPWRVGLTAVVDFGGVRGHWALRHPRAAPDFHDADGFTARLEGHAR